MPQRRRGRALIALAAGVAVLALAGCGRDDFENDPRPPTPAEVSVEVGDKGVVVSPGEFGAGLVNFTIANLSDAATTVTFEGPTEAESDEILPGGTAILKTEVETGDYEAAASGQDADPFEFEVGPERESAQDDLLLP
jgi:hypothetical protein